MDNTVTLVGNVTDRPELRFTEQGTALATFSVAVSHSTRSESGEWQDVRDGYFRCSAWRELAQNVAESVSKGDRVIVVGRLRQDSYEDSRGHTRNAVQITVDEVGPSLRYGTVSLSKAERKGEHRLTPAV